MLTLNWKQLTLTIGGSLVMLFCHLLLLSEVPAVWLLQEKRLWGDGLMLEAQRFENAQITFCQQKFLSPHPPAFSWEGKEAYRKGQISSLRHITQSLVNEFCLDGNVLVDVIFLADQLCLLKNALSSVFVWFLLITKHFFKREEAFC